MKKSRMAIVMACVAGLLAGESQAEPLKVYILAGQSNMVGLKPELSFTPAVSKALAGEEKLIALFAQRDPQTEQPGVDDLYPVGTQYHGSQHLFSGGNTTCRQQR